MNQSWRLKAYLTLFTALLSIYLLVPTFGSFNAIRDEAFKTGKPVPWYLKFFPEKELNLGLDLRGGIYLELEVTVEEAINNRLDLMASELSRYMKEENIQGSADRVAKTHRIRLLVSDPTGLKKVKDHINDIYKGVLQLDSENQELAFSTDEKDEAKLQSLYQDLIAAAKENPSILEVEHPSATNLYRVVLKADAKPDEVKTFVTSKFASLKELNESNKFIYSGVDAYIQKLRSDSVKQAVETIRNRIDRYGVSEPSIRQLGENRVVVELPGVTDPDRAIGIVKKSGKLEFKIVDTSKTPEEIKSLVSTARKENNIPEGFSEEIVLKVNEALKGKIPSESEILFELQRDPVTNKVVSGVPFLIKHKAEVTGDMLRATQVSVNNNDPYVSLSFNSVGTKVFGDVTAANVGKQLAIILDGNVSKAPVIQNAIPNGEAQITLGLGDYNALIREAEDLVLVLREGALPASLKEITKTIIGPSLGKSAIHNGLIAALIAGLTVMIFMILYYKGSGLIADLVLGLNVLLIMGVLALFQATVTLPGIAGIVLTMGMALDANVIIFERIREEVRSGKSVKAAVEAGFSNAMTAVVDTHLTTFLSGLVLYQFGTGPIRGFAVTLMVGVLTTLFTAYLVTKLIFEYLTQKVKIQKVSI